MKIEDAAKSIALTSVASSRDDDTLSSGSLSQEDSQAISMPGGTMISLKDFANDWFAARQNYISLIQSVYQKRGKKVDLNFINESVEHKLYKRTFWTSKVTLPGLESYGEFMSVANAPGCVFMEGERAFYGQMKEAQNAALKAADEAISVKFKELGVAPQWA